MQYLARTRAHLAKSRTARRVVELEPGLRPAEGADLADVKALNRCGIEHDLYRRWVGSAPPAPSLERIMS